MTWRRAYYVVSACTAPIASFQSSNLSLYYPAPSHFWCCDHRKQDGPQEVDLLSSWPQGTPVQILTGNRRDIGQAFSNPRNGSQIEAHPHDAVLLANLSKQLQLKVSLFEKLDTKIIDATKDEEKIEETVFESADLLASLSAKIALISHTLVTSSPPESPAVTTRMDKETNIQPSGTPCSNSNSQETQQNSKPQTDNHADHVSITSNNVVHQPVADLSNTNHGQLASQAQPPLHDPTEHNLDRHFAVRLPKLEQPVYTGELLEWYPFWDCFEAAIHTNPSLTNVQRLSYLRAQVKGDAARVISELPLTNLNYKNSVTLL